MSEQLKPGSESDMDHTDRDVPETAGRFDPRFASDAGSDVPRTPVELMTGPNGELNLPGLSTDGKPINQEILFRQPEAGATPDETQDSDMSAEGDDA